MKQSKIIFEFNHKSRGSFKYCRLSINEKINVKSRCFLMGYFNHEIHNADILGNFERVERPYFPAFDYPHYQLGTKF